MKLLFKSLLVLSIAVLGFLCVKSILDPIEFENTQKIREQAVINRLIDIRKAEVEYRNLYGKYTASYDTLIDFVKNGKLPFVMKEGLLSDFQLESGLTEKKAMEIIKKGNKAEIEKNMLQGFRRDTVFVTVADTLFHKGFNVDSLAYVPYGEGAKFEIAVGTLPTASGFVMQLFEAKTPYNVYLQGLDRQEIINLNDKAHKMEKYAGLQVGSIKEANNNAGNWE